MAQDKEDKDFGRTSSYLPNQCFLTVRALLPTSTRLDGAIPLQIQILILESGHGGAGLFLPALQES